MIEIRHYINRAGRDVFDDWLTQLADVRAQAKIELASIGLLLGISATASLCGKDFTNCESIGDQATECTLR